MSEYRNITRMEKKKYYHCSNSWFVRIRWKNKSYRKSFADSKCGGKMSALLAALTWRNKIKTKIGMPIVDFLVKGISNSSTNVIGVFEEEHRFVVFWTDYYGRRSATSYSKLKYGREKAFKLAIKKRTKMNDLKINQSFINNKPYTKINKYQLEDYQNTFMFMKRKLKRELKSTDFLNTKPSKTSYINKFGSWHKTKEFFNEMENNQS